MKAADVVFMGGPVYTVDVARSRAEGVAVLDGNIVAVDRGAGLDDWIGPDTEVIDLNGRMLIPGFQDSHVHPPTGGLGLLRCNLHAGVTRRDHLDEISRYSRSNPDQAWILGGGWGMDAFPGGIPTAAELDVVVADRPVFLVNRDGHGAWVNSLALELAGITAGSPDPGDGRIERDEHGNPIGCLQEGAMSLMDGVVPQNSLDDYERGILAGQEYLLAFGVTSWQDADVTPATEQAYRNLAARGDLIARVVGALWWERSIGEEQIDELIARRARGPVGNFRPSSVKMMLDGVFENFTASMLEPFLGKDGRPTRNRGIDFIDPRKLGGYVTRLDAEGFQVHFHAIGDRAVRNALNAVEEARRTNGTNDLRHHISHIQVVHPDDIPRFRQLGVVANGQPFWACREGYQVDLTMPFLGPERSAWQYPFGSLVADGAVLAFGSDWSVSTPNPLLEIETAVNRIAPHDRDEEPFFPEERVDLDTALSAFTIGSAYVNHLDDVTGSIEVGKLADLVVLDRDIFEDGPIGDAAVELTMVGGKVAFSKE